VLPVVTEGGRRRCDGLTLSPHPATALVRFITTGFISDAPAK